MLKRTLVFEGRALEASERLRELHLPSLPLLAHMHEILQAQHAERVTSLPDPCHLVQFALVGGRGVGKTSLACSYAKQARDPTMVQIPFVRVMADDTPMRVLLRDTSWPAGLPTSLFLFGKDALLLVIDLTDPKSLQDVSEWVQSESAQVMPAKLLLGNKADMAAQRKVSRKEAEQCALAHGLAYFETSAEDGTGVDAAMDYAIFHALSKLKSLPPQQPSFENLRRVQGCSVQ